MRHAAPSRRPPFSPFSLTRTCGRKGPPNRHGLTGGMEARRTHRLQSDGGLPRGPRSQLQRTVHRVHRAVSPGVDGGGEVESECLLSVCMETPHKAASVQNKTTAFLGCKRYESKFNSIIFSEVRRSCHCLDQDGSAPVTFTCGFHHNHIQWQVRASAGLPFLSLFRFGW